jgi:hypothetical protein
MEFAAPFATAIGRGPGQQGFGHAVQGFDVSNKGFFQVRLQMKKIGWFSRLSNQQLSNAMIQRIAGGIGVAVLL